MKTFLLIFFESDIKYIKELSIREKKLLIYYTFVYIIFFLFVFYIEVIKVEKIIYYLIFYLIYKSFMTLLSSYITNNYKKLKILLFMQK
jgi:hypothetical protein